MALSRIAADLVRLPRRTWQLLKTGAPALAQLARETQRAAKLQSEGLKRASDTHHRVDTLQNEMRTIRDEVRGLHRELRDRLLQYHLQLGRLTRGSNDAGVTPDTRLSAHTVPLALDEPEEPQWDLIGGDAVLPDAEDAEWALADTCPVCLHCERTVVNPWNKFILLPKAPGPTSARYDYAVCHACGVLYASRRPAGPRYQFLLEHFGEVTAKRGGVREISNRVLNPYPLSDEDREELRTRARHGVFVSDHLGLRSTDYLAPLLRDRWENSVHLDIIGSLLAPRGARVLEVRSRTGTILDGLRHAYQARVYAMPIWESQQFLLREVYGIETSDLIDFDRFEIPFAEQFDVIICNHMFTHALRPLEFFAELRRKLVPGGHIYLHNEPDDAEYLSGNQSMLATLNPLHVQAFDQRSLMRALAANGFETVFIKRRNLAHLCLARLAAARTTPMSESQQRSRVAQYEAAFARAVLAVDEHLRPRVGAYWSEAVERGVAAGVAEFDASGRLKLVTR
jgi:SAM-dependent methyltransferase